jgi:hypothetical protein
MKSPLERRHERIGLTGRKAEKHAATRIGATLSRNSGAGIQKSDMYVGGYQIEMKSTVQKTLSIRRSWLAKLIDEALNRQREPALLVAFTNQQGRPGPEGNWVLVREQHWHDLNTIAHNATQELIGGGGKPEPEDGPSVDAHGPDDEA